MSIQLRYGNRHLVDYSKLQSYSSTFELQFSTDAQLAEFSKKVDKGLVVVIENIGVQQEVPLPRESYNVIPYGQRSVSVRFTDKRIAPYVDSLLTGRFIHFTSATGAHLAHEIGRTLMHAVASSSHVRKEIHVYHRSPVSSFAHVLLRELGYHRVRSGMTREEFLSEFTPALAERELDRVLHTLGFRVQFMEHDNKPREFFRSLFGTNIIEFAETAQLAEDVHANAKR